MSNAKKTIPNNSSPKPLNEDRNLGIKVPESGKGNPPIKKG
ncbi:hypothetical protein P7D50_00670 [Enterococcus dongliensis]|nr:hypothetical protein [Enterococcus dongliensis]MDT2646338.1 hypothetical protein [Enterococcus dongliensis]